MGMQNASDVTTVAHVIQLPVAPVFLLTGIGTILNVITNRLAREVFLATGNIVTGKK